ncbi:uncharacterized protein LOC143372424 [Andrena cerasifolii]|uniref:uncharacterized protein LOC143372424 n=1 Tax=Andrena cerasifolii TaxID=2819439 RepID=UPI004037AB8B
MYFYLQADMDQRGKRVTTKPARYQTTSSEEEAPKRRRTSTAPRPPIDQDIDDLRMVLQEHGSTTSKSVPTVDQSNICIFQDNYAVSVPAPAPFTYHQDPGTSSARATVIQVSRVSCLLIRYVSIRSVCRRMNTLLLSIQKSVLATHNTGQPMKPAVLPLSSVQEVDCFEDIDDNTYSKVVKYFEYVGGFDLKGAGKCCFKEALPDDLTLSFTWFGREGLRSLYDTRIARAIFEGVAQNPKFQKPTRSDFQLWMQTELEASKERIRCRKRGPRTSPSQEPRVPRSFWSDQQPDEADDDL